MLRFTPERTAIRINYRNKLSWFPQRIFQHETDFTS